MSAYEKQKFLEYEDFFEKWFLKPWGEYGKFLLG